MKGEPPEIDTSGLPDKAAGVARTVARAIWGVGIHLDVDDLELLAHAVTVALRGIIPESYYEGAVDD